MYGVSTQVDCSFLPSVGCLGESGNDVQQSPETKRGKNVGVLPMHRLKN